jgi:hypothetical protein
MRHGFILNNEDNEISLLNDIYLEEDHGKYEGSFCVLLCCHSKSRDSSVGIALGYGLDDRGSRVRFPSGAGNFSLHHRVRNGAGAHPASYPMGTRGSFSGSKAAVA